VLELLFDGGRQFAEFHAQLAVQDAGLADGNPFYLPFCPAFRQRHRSLRNRIPKRAFTDKRFTTGTLIAQGAREVIHAARAPSGVFAGLNFDIELLPVGVLRPDIKHDV